MFLMSPPLVRATFEMPTNSVGARVPPILFVSLLPLSLSLNLAPLTPSHSQWPLVCYSMFLGPHHICGARGKVGARWVRGSERGARVSKGREREQEGARGEWEGVRGARGSERKQEGARGARGSEREWGEQGELPALFSLPAHSSLFPVLSSLPAHSSLFPAHSQWAINSLVCNGGPHYLWGAMG